MVEQNGARLNPGTSLDELSELKNQLLSRPFRPKRASVEVKARTGGIKQAVVRSIELSDKPLALGQIHRACQDYLGQPVNYNTVKDCVHKHSRGKNPLFVRTGHGKYMPYVAPAAERSEAMKSELKSPYGLKVRRRRYPGGSPSPEATS